MTAQTGPVPAPVTTPARLRLSRRLFPALQLVDQLVEYGRGVTARWWWWQTRAARLGRRLLGLLAGLTGLAFAAPAAAVADDGKLGQTPSLLSFINLTDSRGVKVWNYEMSIDRGGITSPGKMLWSYPLDIFWGIYKSVVVVVIWLIGWILNFGWVQKLAAPAEALGRALTGLVDRFGATPTFLTIAAVVAGIAMLRGKWSLGIAELATSLVIAALATGILSNPVGLVVGDNGLIIKARDAGIEVSSGLANDGDTTSSTDTINTQLTGTLSDTFIRTPAELLNFGKILDGGKCEQTYTDAVKGGPYGSDDDIRDKVGDCDSDAGDYAANPGPGQAISAALLTPTTALLLILALLLCGAVVLAVVSAIYQSLKAIVALVTGLLPGVARGSLWQTVADACMSLVLIAFSLIFLTGYLLLLQSIFTETGNSDGPLPTFIFIDILMAVGIVLYWRARKAIKRAAERLARMLATRPAGKATELPGRSQGGGQTLRRAASAAGSIAANRYSQGRLLKQLRPAAGALAGAGGGVGAAGGAGSAFGGGATGGGAGPLRWTATRGDDDGGGGPAGIGGLGGPGGPGPSGGGGGGLNRRLAALGGAGAKGALLKVGATVAAGVASGGTVTAAQLGAAAATGAGSSIAGRALSQVRGDRRAALTTSLGQAKAITADDSRRDTSPFAAPPGRVPPPPGGPSRRDTTTATGSFVPPVPPPPDGGRRPATRPATTRPVEDPRPPRAPRPARAPDSNAANRLQAALNARRGRGGSGRGGSSRGGAGRGGSGR